MNHRERMMAGLPYLGGKDGLPELRMQNKRRVDRLNRTKPWHRGLLERRARAILGKAGAEIMIEPPFFCDYGKNIEVGDYFFANYNCMILDVAKVSIGDNCFMAPGVCIYTAGHPVHWEARNTDYEYGIPVTIGDNVWIGGNAVINPGVTIGSGAVIGSGSVVTRDIPPAVVAAGNPCRVLRSLTEEDKKYYFRDRLFDINPFLG